MKMSYMIFLKGGKQGKFQDIIRVMKEKEEEGEEKSHTNEERQ